MNQIIKSKIENLLADEFSCTLEDLNGKDTVHTVKPDTSKSHLKMLAYRNCVIICTSEGISERMQKLLKGKSRDEIFECPFVYGQTIHYVPGDNTPNRSSMPSGYRCEVLFGEEILSLRGLDGFDNSLAFDENGATSAKAVCIARESGQDGEIIGAAGASETSSDGVWEVGVDVREGHRNAGLATYLVSRLTGELLRRGIFFFIRHLSQMSAPRWWRQGADMCRAGWIHSERPLMGVRCMGILSAEYHCSLCCNCCCG